MTDVVAVPVSFIVMVGILALFFGFIFIAIEVKRKQKALRFNNTRRYYVPDWLYEFCEVPLSDHFNRLIRHSIWGVIFFFVLMNVAIMTFIGANNILNANHALIVPVVILLAASYTVPIFIPVYVLAEWTVFYGKAMCLSWIEHIEDKYPMELVK